MAARSGRGGGAGISTAHKGLQLDIERLFATRVKVFGSVSFEAESIMLCVLKVCCQPKVKI